MSNAVLFISNCYSQLLTDDDELKQNLWRLLRFRERGYFHSTLYKQRKWDGYVDFFSISSGKFLTGLLPEVQLVLESFDVKYSIKDSRQPFVWACQEIDKDFLRKFQRRGEKPFVLYDYQVDLVNQVLKYDRATIQAPTGAGKSEIMAVILKCLPPKTPALVLANRKSLVAQNYETLTRWKVPDVGRLYEDHQDPNFVTCATVQSLHKMEKLLPKIKVLIVDEIHEMMTATSKKWYKRMSECAVRVAVSATPFKYGGKDQVQKYSVKGYFGPVMRIQSADEEGLLTTKELQERGNLSKSMCTFWPVTEPDLSFEPFQDAVTYGIAKNLYFHQIVTRLVKTKRGRTLILVERIEHGDTLASMIPGALWVQGKDDTDTRMYVIKKLQTATERTVAIATQGIFNAGINIKAHCLVNAAGGTAEHIMKQRIGRGLRPADDKVRLDYNDFVFDINDYLLSHSMHRISILRKDGHEVVVKDKLEF